MEESYSFQAVTEGQTKSTLNLYLSIVKLQPDPITFLEQIYGSLCSAVEKEPILDLDNPFTDSPAYQRIIIAETVGLILSVSNEHIATLHENLVDLKSMIDSGEFDDDDDNDEEGDDLFDGDDSDDDSDSEELDD